MYWFGSDYAEEMRQHGLAEMVSSEKNFVRDIVLSADLSNPKYLYRFGEYVTDNEIKMVEHLNSLSQDDIDKLATTLQKAIELVLLLQVRIFQLRRLLLFITILDLRESSKRL